MERNELVYETLKKFAVAVLNEKGARTAQKAQEYQREMNDCVAAILAEFNAKDAEIERLRKDYEESDKIYMKNMNGLNEEIKRLRAELQEAKKANIKAESYIDTLHLKRNDLEAELAKTNKEWGAICDNAYKKHREIEDHLERMREIVEAARVYLEQSEGGKASMDSFLDASASLRKALMAFDEAAKGDAR